MARRGGTYWLTLCQYVALVGLCMSSGSRPNIVIFLADDLGIGDVGCFGNDTIRTPNIDRIARDGATLTHHLAAAAVCTPSRAAFLTGRYPIRMGMVPHNLMRVNLFISSVSGLPEEEVTFAELAKQRGYTTGLIGKWHLGLHCGIHGYNCHSPLNQGFDYFYGLPLSNSKSFFGQSIFRSRLPHLDGMIVGFYVGTLSLLALLFKSGFIRLWFVIVCSLITTIAVGYFVCIIYFRNILFGIVMKNNDVIEQPILITQSFTKRLVYEGNKFLEARHSDGQPFLLYMPWLQVHVGLHAGPEFRGKSKHGAYGDEVEEMDWGVGAIMSTLEKYGMLENTLVYFSSDNGGHLEEKGPDGRQEGGWNGVYRGGKGQGGMDGGIRMPAVAMWPGKIQPGTVVDLPTSQMDVFATLAAILELPLPTDRVMDGVDIMPVLTGHSQSPPHEFLFHYCGDQLHAARYTPSDNKGDVWKAYFMTPKWLPGTQQCRWICDCHGSHVTVHDSPLLFNIGKDPSEKQQLDVKEPHSRDIIKRITQAVEEHKQSIKPVPSQFALHRLLPRPWLQPCCGGFPNCKCMDQEHAEMLK